ncbi:MAG: hypothetical protein K2W85_04390 [Phycisphaerales bacterium]|nr:hypothetical protein [Phycisphaerales bacterium]
MSTTGDISWPDDAADRRTVACAIAGLLAELGIARLIMTDPRHCAAVTLNTRETNLPEVLCSSQPGTVLCAAQGEPKLDLLIDANCLRFAVDDHYAGSFASISSS